MKRLSLLLTLLIALSAAAWSADARTLQAQKAVQAAYDRMAAAAAKRDVDGWLALKTDDFVSVGLDGKEVSLESRKAMMKLVMTTVEKVRASTKILSFRLLGADRAQATIREHTEMTFTRMDKKRSTMVIDTTAEALWVKTPAGWREKRSRSLKEQGTLDGRPMPAPKA